MLVRKDLGERLFDLPESDVPRFSFRTWGGRVSAPGLRTWPAT